MSANASQPERIQRQPWYADGLRFECTQCGNCCTGPPGYVWFTRSEGQAMAAQLEMDESTFCSTYARRAMGRWSLNECETEHGHDCILLDRESQPGRALCRVYKARPHQCRTWPFWPENLRSEAAWNQTKKLTPCPGMDQGTLVAAEDIRIIRDSTPEK